MPSHTFEYNVFKVSYIVIISEHIPKYLYDFWRSQYINILSFQNLWLYWLLLLSLLGEWSESHSVFSDFPTQGLDPGLPHCRWILYQLSYKGRPRILMWVAYLFSSRSSWPRNQTGVSYIEGGFFTNSAIKNQLGSFKKYVGAWDVFLDILKQDLWEGVQVCRFLKST